MYGGKRSREEEEKSANYANARTLFFPHNDKDTHLKMFFPRSSYYDTLHHMAPLPIICGHGANGCEEYQEYADDNDHCDPSSAYFYPGEEQNLPPSSSSSSSSFDVSLHKTLSHTPTIVANSGFQQNFDNSYDDTDTFETDDNEPFYNSHQIYTPSASQFNQAPLNNPQLHQQQPQQHSTSQQQQQFSFQTLPPPPSQTTSPHQMSFINTSKQFKPQIQQQQFQQHPEIQMGSFLMAQQSYCDPKEEMAVSISPEKSFAKSKIDPNHHQHQQQPDQKNKYRKDISNFPPIVSAVAFHTQQEQNCTFQSPPPPSSSSSSSTSSSTSSSNQSASPLNPPQYTPSSATSSAVITPSIPSISNSSPQHMIKMEAPEIAQISTIASSVTSSARSSSASAASSSSVSPLQQQQQQQQVKSGCGNNTTFSLLNNSNNSNEDNGGSVGMPVTTFGNGVQIFGQGQENDVTESVNTIVSLAVALRDRDPLEFKRLMKMLNSLSDENKPKPRKKQKKPPFFISTNYPFPESDKDKYSVKESSDDGGNEMTSFTLDGASANGNNNSCGSCDGKPLLKKAKIGEARAGKKSSSAKKFNLPKIFSESEYYKCSFCNEKKTENSFRNHIHNNEKFRINWYCPICEKEYAVTYRGAHLKEKHGVSKDPKASEMQSLASPSMRPPLTMNNMVTPTLSPQSQQQPQQQQQQHQQTTP